MSDDWEQEFRKVWDRGVDAWKEGRRSAKTMFSPEDAAFLATIGCTAQELFDFVDDSLEYRDFGFETVLAVTAIRRRYFLEVMGGKPSGRVVPMSSLPAKNAQVDGIAWLPRLIAKARIKLRGEMEHYAYRDISHHLQKIDAYTTLIAEQWVEEGRRTTPVQLAVHPILAFLRNYVIRAGVGQGAVGLIISLLNSYYVFLKFAKLWERQHVR